MVEFKIRSLTPITSVQRVEIRFSQDRGGTLVTMTSREKVKLFGSILSKLVRGDKLVEEGLSDSILRLNRVRFESCV